MTTDPEIAINKSAVESAGFDVTSVIQVENAFPKFICKLRTGTSLPRARTALEKLGFDLTTHAVDGVVHGWAAIKRTSEGKGWR